MEIVYGIDINNIYFKRAIDMNDRALRKVTIAQTLKKEKIRDDNFIITVATEMMAILCISKDIKDLRKRVENIIIAKNVNGGYVYVRDLNITGSVIALLKEAIKPNLVKTLEDTPVIIHGGPFANIAHGCSSIIGTDLALRLADYVITEAGFGADLGAEKFLDIKTRELGKESDLIILVVSLRAVKEKSFEKGIQNILKHYNNLTRFNKKVIICINKFETDDKKEIDLLKNKLMEENNNIIIEECTSWKDGGKGAENIARRIVKEINEIKNDGLENNEINYVYNIEDDIKEKIEKLNNRIYRVNKIIYTKNAENKLKEFEDIIKNKYVCVAKSPYSFTDNDEEIEENTSMTITDISVSNGVGFVVVYTSGVMLMPGLPSVPQAERIDVDKNGNIVRNAINKYLINKLKY
jgi:formate--tetrahydrofolate ligase